MVILKQNIIDSFNNKTSEQAIIFNNKVLTYSNFKDIILSIASAISMVKKELNKDFINVAIFSYRNEFSYAAPISTILSNSCFIPLNQKFPRERNITILNLIKADLIILDEECAIDFYEIYCQLSCKPFVYVFTNNMEVSLLYDNRLIGNEILNTEFHISSFDHVAYILFTSGSTGEPKGVPIRYSNLENIILLANSLYNFSKGDRFSQTFEQTFDLSIFDLFACFSSGGCLVIAQMLDLLNPYKFIENHKITIWFSVPSVVSLTNASYKTTNASLRISLFCGEILMKEVADKWLKFAPNTIIENLYGPTELTIACSRYRLQDEANSILPIGKLFPNHDFVIIDEENNKVEKGELCVSGPQMFKGYLNKDYNFLNIDGNFYYKTGDLVYLNEDKDLVCLGRIDSQVKLQGYRVELSEVEVIINRIDEIEKAIVVCIGNQRKSLVAFIKINNSLEVNFIRKNVERFLPWYMIPENFIIVKDFPINTNGKIDRKVLQEEYENERKLY